MRGVRGKAAMLGGYHGAPPQVVRNAMAALGEGESSSGPKPRLSLRPTKPQNRPRAARVWATKVTSPAVSTSWWLIRVLSDNSMLGQGATGDMSS